MVGAGDGVGVGWCEEGGGLRLGKLGGGARLLAVCIPMRALTEWGRCCVLLCVRLI